METALLASAAAVLGLAVGSFLNVVVYRVPGGLSVVRPASACPECRTPIRGRDNVPLLSWIFLRGKCRACGVRIPVRYPLVEALTGALFVLAVLRFDRLEHAAFAAAACAVLLTLAFIDLDHRRVPNVIVLPATVVALIWVAGASALDGTFRPVVESVASGMAGYVLLAAIAIVSGGMGFGDVKLVRFIGVVTGRFGWEVFVLSLFSGFVAGGLVAIALLVTGRSGRKDAIPFAPMLCFGGVVGLFAGPGPVRQWFGF